ncbi:urea transporter [Pseudomonas aeruginosa]|nr:urea transporter [Pseudomonas aeruginosa]
MGLPRQLRRRDRPAPRRGGDAGARRRPRPRGRRRPPAPPGPGPPPPAAWAPAGAAARRPGAGGPGYDGASARAGFYGLNAALAGLALALRYRSVWPPLLGMGLAVALQPLFGLLGLPALTAPFILACLLCIGGERLYLRLAGSLGARLGRRRS